MIDNLHFKIIINHTIDEEYQTTHWQVNDEYSKMLELDEKIESKNADKLKQLHDALVSSITLEKYQLLNIQGPRRRSTHAAQQTPFRRQLPRRR